MRFSAVVLAVLFSVAAAAPVSIAAAAPVNGAAAALVGVAMAKRDAAAGKVTSGGVDAEDDDEDDDDDDHNIRSVAAAAPVSVAAAVPVNGAAAVLVGVAMAKRDAPAGKVVSGGVDDAEDDDEDGDGDDAPFDVRTKIADGVPLGPKISQLDAISQGITEGVLAGYDPTL